MLNEKWVHEILLDSDKSHNLVFGDVETGDVIGASKRRKGQRTLRDRTLYNYGNRCALCDVVDDGLLVTSHIAKWAEDPEGRGDLGNIILFCRFHDALFENGYFSLDDSCKLLERNRSDSKMIDTVFALTSEFRRPKASAPLPVYLRQHRSRTGYESRG